MIKSLRAEIIQYTIIGILIFIIGISGLLELLFISLGGIVLCIVVGLYYEIQNRRNPYSENPEEIKELKKKLDNNVVQEFIRDSFFNKGKSLSKISRDLEEKFNIQVLIPKGFDSGNYKSRELIDKLYQTLGCETKDEINEAYRERKRKKKEK